MEKETALRNTDDPELSGDVVIEVSDLDFYYGRQQALYGISMPIPRHKITAIIGPSGCGKSTFIRCLNRMNDLVPGTRVVGTVARNGADINAEATDPVDLRRCRIRPASARRARLEADC